MTKAVIEHGMSEAPRDKDGKTLPKEKHEFSPGVVNIVTIIGGLVSALVVAKPCLPGGKFGKPGRATKHACAFLEAEHRDACGHLTQAKKSRAKK